MRRFHAHQIKNWILLLRANFLILTIVIVALGLTAAFHTHRLLEPLTSLLTLLGALLTHTSANVMNNYFDYISGVDERTQKTPFSGGVDVLVNGKVRPSSAWIAGMLSMGGAALVGLFFLLRHFWFVLPMIVYGAVSIYFYTPRLSRLPGASEIVVGSNFGLMALGAYAIQTGSVDMVALVILFIVSLVVGLLLFLNELPDLEVDRGSGRRSMVVLLGRKRSSRAYGVLLGLIYLLIACSVLVGVMPLTCLVAIAAAPFGVRALRIAMNHYDDITSLTQALSLNVLVVLLTIALLSVGFLAATFL
jgi:1,4-dihydroxy-2-naphthoate octaprenyltransferase